jgi:hypothetical protein
MGLACDKTQDLHCNRVGLAVWLQHPASTVTARLDGRVLMLSTKAGGSHAYARTLFWQVFFHDAHAQAWADAARSIPVRVFATTPAGKVMTTETLVFVSEGYG